MQIDLLLRYLISKIKSVFPIFFFMFFMVSFFYSVNFIADDFIHHFKCTKHCDGGPEECKNE